MQLPETTIILHDNAKIGKIKYGIFQTKSKAKYVEPPPKPTLEYKIAVTKNNIAKEIKFIYPIIIYASKYSFINYNRHKNY